MKLKEFYKKKYEILEKNLSDKNECNFLIRRLLEHFLKVNYTDILLDKNVEITTDIEREINECTVRLCNNEPIQYILGYEYFLDRKFIVNKNVLIPRPETEDLILYVLENNKSENLSVLDIGTGSGCIAISLKKDLNNANVHAIDISSEALSIASINAKNLNADILLIKEDILQTAQLQQKYDIMVSNPPYVLESEKKMMSANVLDYEPHNALFVSDNNGLIFYEKITELAKKFLKSKGKIYFEINEALGDEVKELLINHSFKNVYILNDRHEKNRFVEATQK